MSINPSRPCCQHRATPSKRAATDERRGDAASLCKPEHALPNPARQLLAKPASEWRPTSNVPRLLMFVVALLFGMSMAVAQEQRAAGEVQQTVQRIMAEPEFRHLEQEINDADKAATNTELPKWFEEVLKRFFKWMFSDRQSNGDASSLFGISELLFYAAIVVGVGLLVFLLVMLLKRIEPATVKRPFKLGTDEEALHPTVPPGEYPPSIYEVRAVQFANDGNYRAALRELVLGSMSWAERAGMIRHRLGLTNRDYIRAIWREAEQREAMLLIVAAFELVFFGRRPAESRQFEHCLSGFQQAFREQFVEAEVTACDPAIDG